MKSQCGNCLELFETKGKQTMYCSLECEQQHDLFLRKNDSDTKYRITASIEASKFKKKAKKPLHEKHQKHINLITNLGFSNIQLYEDDGESIYYDVLLPRGRKGEVMLSDKEAKVYWRELHPTKIEWFTIDIEEHQNTKMKQEATVKETIEQLSFAI